MAGFLNRLRERLDKTRTSLTENVRKAFSSFSAVDENVYEELEEILVQADVGVAIALDLIAALRVKAREQAVDDPEVLYDLLKEEIRKLLEQGSHDIVWTRPEGGPHITLIVGVNGSGKTTTAGKLAAKLAAEKRSVLLGAADTFRAAAAEQLTIWAERAQVPIVTHNEGTDPASVAYDTVDTALNKKADNVLIDTAGRLHTKVNLMEELKKVRRVIDRRLPGAPHEVLLVLDATTGQNGLQQARIFTDALNVTGAIITKLDGTAKGGMVIAIQKELGIPIKYIGVGESLEDLQPFDPAEFVDALFN